MEFKRSHEEVEFVSGGKTVGKVTVWQAGALEDGVLLSLSDEARKKNAEELSDSKSPSAADKQRWFYGEYLYPRLAACSTGDVPSADQWMPSTELDKWYAAAKRQNPNWFAAVDEAVKLSEQELKAEKKRGGRRRHKS